VVLDKVFVDFPIYGPRRDLRNTLLRRPVGGLISSADRGRDRVVIRALNGATLHLKDGDRIGLVGRNGAGKSTLLKVIAGIYQPVSGVVQTEGRITTLFHAMPGLNLEDSGYDNIVTAGLLLGMSRREIEAMIPEVEDISGLGEYLSLPVRTYSSGMMTRLNFALVTSIDPAILLMDEGIATGDARFVNRVSQRVNDLIGRSRIVVLASHAREMLHSMCNKAALMKAGKVLSIGKVDEILRLYDAMVS
jgi:ABC-type polysaccharide/polyol phosphate transport system ATPase subunit